ncbi:GTPase HflX [Thermoclostridium stercorarium]|uniref:GTPase HflX n=1 Tax=Thermoclostridium stercorarium TaxID=1510 RepID=UPI000A7F249D|nr:GTPase HflX [Thermoclostridium stercorarium]
MQVNGQTEGLKKGILERLQKIYDMKIPKDQVLTEELTLILAEISSAINREISVLIDRKGNILDVRVGDSNSAAVYPASVRRSESSLSGVRCVHTHPGGRSALSELDISTLKQLHLDMMIALGVSDLKPTDVSCAILTDGMQNVAIYGPFGPFSNRLNEIAEFVYKADKSGKEPAVVQEKRKERALLIGVETPDTPVIMGVSEASISMKELVELAKTAGAEVVDTILQKRPSRDPAYLIGKGKLAEIGRIVQEKEIALVIFDEELSGTQLRNIENFTNTKVVDRTGLILDIFGQRAKSREGQVQVELAQLNYLLPRLQGRGITLSRLGGGIGTRGPGETKLETDRRHIRRRIDYLKKELERIRNQRQTSRRERERNKIPVVALVGYTNAGKSTLLNTLCDADVFAEDKLFATLDTTTRKLKLEEGMTVLLSDTVVHTKASPSSR